MKCPNCKQSFELTTNEAWWNIFGRRLTEPELSKLIIICAIYMWNQSVICKDGQSVLPVDLRIALRNIIGDEQAKSIEFLART